MIAFRQVERPEFKFEKDNLLCLDCLMSNNYCKIHAPKPMSIGEAIAITAEILVQQGIAKRESPNTISINL